MRPLILLCIVTPALASSTLDERPMPPIGTMEVVRRTSEPTSSGERERRPSLDLQLVDISVEVHGDVAQTRVEHDFYNDSSDRLEGTFRFPVPAGADLTGLSMEVNGHMVEGELVERKKAEHVYEQIVDEMRDPALLTWEAGNQFKLRVFPIEPKSHKRVVIRYLTPLEKHGENGRYLFHAEASPLAAHIGHFRFSIDKKVLHDEDHFEPRTIAVDLPLGKVAHRSLKESIDGSTYLRLELPISADARLRPRSPHRWVLVVDVSRSALEGRQLTLDTVRAALSALPASDQFLVLACDIQCQPSASAFSPVTPRATEEVVGFLQSLDFDGATDLGAALQLAAARAKGAGGQVLYIGDGNPTWGTSEPAELIRLLEPAFNTVPLHAVVLGKYAHPAVLTKLSNRSGGLLLTPSIKSDLLPFARALGDYGRVPRLHAISLSAKDAVVTPAEPASLDAGEKLTVFVRSEKGHPLPQSVHLHALADDRAVDQELVVPEAVSMPDVARRFAGSRIRELELEGGHDEEVLALSLGHQVLSSQTAWLVLENDEAYRRYQIERHHKHSGADPSISGKDLESTGGNAANDVGGEGPEPELWLLFGLMAMVFAFRRRLGVAN
jgi:hypothetical protein